MTAVRPIFRGTVADYQRTYGHESRSGFAGVTLQGSATSSEFRSFLQVASQHRIKELDLALDLPPDADYELNRTLRKETCEVRKLTLVSNHIGSMAVLLEGLQENVRFEELCARSYNVERREWRADEIRALACLVDRSHCLRHVHLTHNHVKPELLGPLVQVYNRPKVTQWTFVDGVPCEPRCRPLPVIHGLESQGVLLEFAFPSHT